MRERFTGKDFPDFTDPAEKQRAYERYVDFQAAKGKPVSVSAASLPPDRLSNLPPDYFQVTKIGFDRMPAGTARDETLEKFFQNIDSSLRLNPQTFQKILNTPGEEAIDKILAEYATSSGTPIRTLRDLIDSARVPNAPIAPPPPTPIVAPAKHPHTGAPTELQPITQEQQRLFNASDADIMNAAAAAGGWDDYAQSSPEDVLFIAQHTSTPSIKAAAEGALRRANHIP